MHKKIIFGLGIIILFLGVNTASAQVLTGMTADQLRAEIARLTKVADTLRSKIAQLEAPAGAACLQTNLRMKRGDSGQSVTTLQTFLSNAGVYPPSLITGYFGPATELGVQRWQAANGVVSYGTPSTTGYGLVGPSTLKAMHLGCPGGRYTGPSGSLTTTTTPSATSKPSPKVLVEKYSLSVNPTKGLNPLAVTVTLNITGSTCTSYSLDWGDGTPAISYNSGKRTSCVAKPINITRSHVYNRNGKYKVIFKTGKAPLSEIQTVNTVVVESLPAL